MPVNAGAKPTFTFSPSGTQNVKVVAWDSTASIPAGTSAIGAVSIIAGTATQDVKLVAVGTTAPVTIVNTAGPYTISGTVTGIVAASGTQDVNIVAGGAITQYQQNATAIGATGTGVLIMGIQSGATTSRALVITTSGDQRAFVVNTAAVTIAGGTSDVNLLSPLYQQGGTAVAATGTGVLLMCIQSGGTTSRALAITTSAAAHVFVPDTVTIAGTVTALAAGTQTISGSASIINTVAVSGSVTAIGLATTASFILVGASTTAPVTIVNTAGPFTISGSASVINTVAVSGSVTAIGLSTTADFFCIPTGNSIRYAGTSTNVNQLYLTVTTSAAVILVTSAANKVFIITSLWLNGNTAAAFKLQSATTDIGTMFIATSGVGVVLGHNDHGWNRSTVSQSLVASAAASGSYSGWISYITVSG